MESSVPQVAPEEELTRAIHTASQPYITQEEDAVLRSLHFVKDFFVRIDPAQYFAQRGSVPWETIGLAFRFFMGDIRCANKTLASQARYERRQLRQACISLTADSKLTSGICSNLALWVSSISNIREIPRKGRHSVYVIAEFHEGKPPRSLSHLRSVQLLQRMAEILRERENTHAEQTPSHP